ncbi:uncharacterized protein B0J16DRAFT_368209 [Fusarium flagelliforme]|uniref:uncharacterized protein n=1 Tax=Fusarium flagelliforme TaxID=2675880 RepID=UPI001E8EA417|nr:uncharacterized protein B0J16DRAFT_368209 [Fusarium flagelliforme]KAH7191903.1 hypothetical protein B0J16DRAFT_368209 [Fusarium flagelliforme]
MDNSNATYDMADEQADLRYQLRVAKQTIRRMEEGRRDQELYNRELQETIGRMKEEMDAMARDRRNQDLSLRELHHTADWLRGELSQAARIWDIRVEEEVDRGRAAVASERRLKAVVDEQKAVIQRHVQDKEAADRRIQELEASQNNANPIPVPRDSPPATDNARPSKRRRQESPVTDQRASRVEREQLDRPIVFNDNRRLVPGLSLVRDENITERVIAKLTSVMEKPIGKKNMELFMEYIRPIRPGNYYCIHEVASKGRSAISQWKSSVGLDSWQLGQFGGSQVTLDRLDRLPAQGDFEARAGQGRDAQVEAKVIGDAMANVAPESSDRRVLTPSHQCNGEAAEVEDVPKEVSEVSPQPFFAKGASWALIRVTSGQAIEPHSAVSLESHQAVGGNWSGRAMGSHSAAGLESHQVAQVEYSSNGTSTPRGGMTSSREGVTGIAGSIWPMRAKQETKVSEVAGWKAPVEPMPTRHGKLQEKMSLAPSRPLTLAKPLSTKSRPNDRPIDTDDKGTSGTI